MGLLSPCWREGGVGLTPSPRAMRKSIIVLVFFFLSFSCAFLPSFFSWSGDAEGTGHSLVFFLQGWWKQGWAGPPPHSNAEKARRRPRPPLSSSSSVVPLLVLLSAGFSLSSFFVSGAGEGWWWGEYVIILSLRQQSSPQIFLLGEGRGGGKEQPFLGLSVAELEGRRGGLTPISRANTEKTFASSSSCRPSVSLVFLLCSWSAMGKGALIL